MQKNTLSRRIAVAQGQVPADLVLKNATVVNVFTQELLSADIAIADGVIAGLGSYHGLAEVDCTGKTVCPGLIDAHMHMESTMVAPAELARAIVPTGTTTLIADPHELVNVCGAEGVRYFLEATEGLPLNVYLMLPSSVPATAFETNGADFTAADMAPFLSHPRVLGLGEVMCYPNVLAGDAQILEKLLLFSGAGKYADGHAPGLTGKALQAYAAAGITTEHECTTFAEAAEKLRAGQAVLVREGSAAHNLTTLLTGWLASGLPCERMLMCTDDKHLDDIARDGHILQNVKLAVELGVPAVTAICMATWNTARAYGLRDTGAVAAGYRADLVVLDDLKHCHVLNVYKDGVPVQEALMRGTNAPVPDALLHSMHGAPVTAAQLTLPVGDTAHVIEMIPYQIATKHAVERVPQREGLFVPDSVYTKLCVVERHGKNGNIAVCPLKGYGICGGAIATSVAHDSHNLIAAGDNDADLVLAINRCKEIGGGYVLTGGGRVLGELPLAIGGLMSTQPWQDVQRVTAEMIQRAGGMGIPYYVDPFISLSFLALPVIPELRLTDEGLFDVVAFCRVTDERQGGLKP
ncbi:MAG: adenine deaminase [Ruthenibacterium sp.]